ncbi:MAG: glycoside hydrolase family protein [Rikenellaceae bacterium]
MKKTQLFIAIVTMLLLCSYNATATDPVRPVKPTYDPTLVKGAAFIDRFLPLPSGNISSNCWGASNVVPRNVDNGIEDADHSYWGGNILKGDDGKFHLFGARWPQDISRPNGKSGHEIWWDSDVYHAVSDKITGPYKVVDMIGKGHNPEIYKCKDGTYVIGVMGLKAYKSNSLNGPWEQIETKMEFLRDTHNISNRTYIVREDGSVFMMNKEGGVFGNIDGEIENFVQYDVPKAYFRANGSHEEDPVIWKDEVEYNLVVNDCLARIAYHLTSKDGMKWSYEEGFAYTPEIVVNENGVKESWWKFERPKVSTDEYGRPLVMNFAVVDTLKAHDRANDNHSSKNIVVPLRLERRMELIKPSTIKTSTSSITIELLAEEGFDPFNDVDLQSLRLGAAKLVNHAKGLEVVKSKKSERGLVITFKGDDLGIKEGDYKLKLLGALKSGEPISSKVRIN